MDAKLDTYRSQRNHSIQICAALAVVVGMLWMLETTPKDFAKAVHVFGWLALVMLGVVFVIDGVAALATFWVIAGTRLIMVAKRSGVTLTAEFWLMLGLSTITSVLGCQLMYLQIINHLRH